MSDFQEVTIEQAPTGAEAPAPQRPDDIPEKFWDASTGTVNTTALLASYKALEGKLGSPKEEPAPAAEEEAAPTSEEPKEEVAEQVAEAAGIDIAAVEAHYLENGEVAAETYDQLAKAGVSKEMVDEFVQYRVSRAEALQQEIFATAGGEEAVNKMVAWAAQGYTQSQADAFNAAMGSKDRGQMEIALRALKADYEKVHGSKPSRTVAPVTAPASASGTYQSFAQLLADQRDPLYATDPAFRARVIEKLRRSNI